MWIKYCTQLEEPEPPEAEPPKDAASLGVTAWVLVLHLGFLHHEQWGLPLVF